MATKATSTETLGQILGRTARQVCDAAKEKKEKEDAALAQGLFDGFLKVAVDQCKKAARKGEFSTEVKVTAAFYNNPIVDGMVANWARGNDLTHDSHHQATDEGGTDYYVELYWRKYDPADFDCTD